MRVPAAYLALLFVLSASASTSASPAELTLKDALSLAERNDPSLAAARLDVESGDAVVREAYSSALPGVSLSGGLMHYMEAPEINIPGFGRMRFTRLNDLSIDLTLQQPVWLAGKIGLALKAARTYRQIARDALTGRRAGLKSQVIREYFSLVLAREVVRVTGEALQQASRHAETVKRMFDVGMASEFELLRAQVEVSSLEPELARAEQAAELARVQLAGRLGLEPDAEIVIAESLLDYDNRSAVPEAVDAYAEAVRSRPEFRVNELRQQLNGINLRVQRRSVYWPNLYLGMNYRRQAQEDLLGDLVDWDVWTGAATWMLQLQVPLFDGFATPARIQKAQIGIRQVRLERIQLEQGVRLEVTYTISELQRALRQVSSLKAGLELAEKALQIAQTRFEQGVGTELEVLDVQLALRRARLGYLQGLYDLRVARAEYARVVENDDDLTRVE